MTRATRAFLVGMTALFMFVSARAEGDRSLSVVSFDAATGVASLSFESAETANLLYAVRARGDRGTTDAEAWETAAYLGKVDGATTSDTYALPSDWVEQPGVIRFVLTTDHARLYEAEIDHIVSAEPASGKPHAFVDTGIVPDATTSIEVSFVQRTGDAAAFGVSGRFYLFANGSNSFYGYFNDTGDTGSSFAQFMTDNNKVYTVRLGPDGAWVDGVRKAGPFKNPSTTTTSTLTIGARRADGTSDVAKSGYFRIYGAKVVKGGHLVRDFIPVRTAADGSGERCLFDRVTKTLFRPAAGETVFNNTTRVGAEIVKSSDFPTEVTDWSAPLRLGRSVSVAAFNANTGVASVALTGPAWSGRLFAVHDTTDKGSDPSAWAENAYLARVAGSDNSCEVTLPAAWLSAAGIVRVVWVSDIESPYDEELTSIVSRGSTDADNKGVPVIDTGIYPTLDTTVEVEAFLSAGSVDCAFGLSKVCYLFPNTANDDMFYYGFHSAASSKRTGKYYGAWHTLTVGREGALIDNALVGGPFTEATAVTPYYSLILFGRRNNETGANEKTSWSRSIKRAKVWEGSALVRDYIACSKDGVARFYDRVSGAYVGNGNFYPGNVVTPTMSGSEALAVSDALELSQLKTATWDAGAETAALTAAANWKDDVTPNLTDGNTIVKFAAGEKAVVDTSANVAGVVHATDADFALEETAGGALALGGRGIEMKSGKNFEIKIPMTVAEDQAWRGSGRINVREPLTGDADRVITVQSGTVGLYASSPDYKGTFDFKAGSIAKIFAAPNLFGDAAVGTPVTVDFANCTLFDFFGGTIDRPMSFTTGSNMTGTPIIIHDAATAGGGATVFSAPVTIAGASALSIQVGGGTTNLISGGLTSAPLINVVGSGLTKVAEKPAYLTQGIALVSDGARLELAAVSNGIARIDMAKAKNCRLDLTVDEAAAWVTSHGLTGAPIVSVGTNGVIDVHGTYQTLRNVNLTEPTAHVTGEADSTLRVICHQDATWEGIATGGVTLSVGGGSALTLKGTNTSTGGLLCNAGRIVLESGASWAGTNIVLTAETSASKRLVLKNSSALANGRHTVLNLEGAAQVELAAGVRQKVRRLVVEGRVVGTGTWGSSESDAENKDDVHFAGPGVLDVRGGGLAIVVR